MKNIDPGQTITILANAGVIAGIAFLGLELQQNNELLVQEAQRSRAEAVRENMGVFADNAKIWVKYRAGEPLTAAEAFRMNVMWLRTLFSYQTTFQQLPREEIVAQANGFRRFFETMPSFRTTWEQNRDTYESDFVRFMEENVTSGR